MKLTSTAVGTTKLARSILTGLLAASLSVFALSGASAANADPTAYKTALAAVEETDFTDASWAGYQLIVQIAAVSDQDLQADVDISTGLITAAQVNLVSPASVQAAEVLATAIVLAGTAKGN